MIIFPVDYTTLSTFKVIASRFGWRGRQQTWHSFPEDHPLQSYL